MPVLFVTQVFICIPGWVEEGMDPRQLWGGAGACIDGKAKTSDWADDDVEEEDELVTAEVEMTASRVCADGSVEEMTVEMFECELQVSGVGTALPCWIRVRRSCADCDTLSVACTRR